MRLVLLFCCIVFFNPVICIRQQPPASAPTTASAPVPTPLSQPSTAASDPRIRSICEDTLYTDLCLSSIAPFYNGKTDLETVVGMLIKALTELTETAVTTATKMAADPMYSHDPAMVEALRSCHELYYDEALNYLKQATDALLVHDIGKVDDFIDFATSDYDSCDDRLTWPTDYFSEVVSPMADEQPERISPVGNVVPERISPMAEIYDELSNFGNIIGDIIFDIEYPY